MNRRELLKVAGTTLVSSLVADCAAPGQPAVSAEQGGDFTLMMHGPGILRFPKGGSSATLYFTAFPQSHCPAPVHLPRLSIESGKAECTTAGQIGKDNWMVAGLTIEPQMTGSFSAPDYDRVPKPNPYAYPSSEAESASLQWVPMLAANIDQGAIKSVNEALDKASTAVVSMQSGVLGAMPTYYPEARSVLWIWATQNDWNKRLNNDLNVQEVEPQSYMTDLIVLKGRYTGSQAVIRLRSLLSPDVFFDLAFKPANGDTSVTVYVVAEPPDGDSAPSQPLELYCPYYDVIGTKGDDRLLPFHSPHTFPPVKLQKALADQLDRLHHRPFAARHTQPRAVDLKFSPKPECGSMRIIG